MSKETKTFFELKIGGAFQHMEAQGDDKVIHQLAELVRKANKITGCTGAGISTESGVPDFRTPKTGLWETFDSEAFVLDNITDIGQPTIRERYWRYASQLYDAFKAAQPNPAHKFFGYLHQKGKLLAVITQNVDDLHERGGVPVEKLIRLHGTGASARCWECRKPYDREEIQAKLKSGEIKAPVCTECGGAVKPDTIAFGQQLDHQVLDEAIKAANETDLMIVVGTSLVVSPARNIPMIAKIASAQVVIVNVSPTYFDTQATLRIGHDKCGNVLAKVMEILEAGEGAKEEGTTKESS